jgi:hypothetical protein
VGKPNDGPERAHAKTVISELLRMRDTPADLADGRADAHGSSDICWMCAGASADAPERRLRCRFPVRVAPGSQPTGEADDLSIGEFLMTNEEIDASTF